MRAMQTTAAIQAFKGVKPLADALKISVQAVYQWGDVVPKLREYEIREIRPDIGTNVPENKEQATA